ncbi:MAG: PD-(D/E)XK nuclease family protein, partial [Deltaproteobacteria bacterium]|nr:PD-(D/E)XK nuclease family protein [Deltaproteobacteria bacterium]
MPSTKTRRPATERSSTRSLKTPARKPRTPASKCSSSKRRSSRGAPNLSATRPTKGTPRLQLPDIRSGSSEAGYHFASLFDLCQWKFFLKFIVGLEPEKKAAPLLFGSAFHYGAAAFYVLKDVDEAISLAGKALRASADEMEDPGKLNAMTQRLTVLLGKWISVLGVKDLEQYDIIDVEREINVPVPGLKDFYFTGRLDAVVRDKRTGLLSIIEKKTSGYSIQLTEDALHYGDQVTGQIWLAEHYYGERIQAVIPDIAHWPKASVNPSLIRPYRGALITRSKDDIEP